MRAPLSPTPHDSTHTRAQQSSVPAEEFGTHMTRALLLPSIHVLRMGQLGLSWVNIEQCMQKEMLKHISMTIHFAQFSQNKDTEMVFL